MYRYFDTPATYDEARDTCSGIDGEMATITTKPQFEILQKLITSQQFEPRLVEENSTEVKESAGCEL